MEHSMYDTILSLPLFKGVSSKDVLRFIEKTKLDFRSYPSGTCLLGNKDRIDGVGFILHGCVKVTSRFYGDKVTIVQKLGEGFWLQPESMFGLVREAGSTYECETKVGMLWISMSQLLELIRKQKLCRWNFMNYLCYRAQCRRICAEAAISKCGQLEKWLSVVLPAATERRAQSIKIFVAIEELAEILHIEEKTLKSQVISLSRQKKISYTRGALVVFNRRDYF